MRKYIGLIVLFFVIHSSNAYCQASIKANTEKNKVGLSEEFQVDYVIEAGGGNFTPPSFKDFNVEETGRKMTSTTTFFYVLTPKALGKYTIGPATLTWNGKSYVSNSLTIEVVKEATDDKAMPDDNLFLRVIVDKTNVYLGEPIYATIKVYTKIDLYGGDLTKQPTYDGFWSQDVDARQQHVVEQESINGVNYRVVALRKAILIPQRAGEMTLGPYESEFVVMGKSKKKQRNDPFDPFGGLMGDPFGGSRQINVKKYSAPVKITVKDLPDNAPASFKGAVGKYSLDVTLDKTETKSNEPVSLKVKISGTGNLKLIDPLPLEFPQDIESYDPKIADNSTVSVGGIGGSKTFEYLLLPRHSGDYKIPSVEFTYFDLDRKQYVTLNSKEYNLKVTKGSGSESSVAINGVNKEDVQLLGKDIRYIKIGNITLHKKGDEFFGSPAFYTLFISPMFLFIGFLVYYRKNKELQKNVTLLKSKKATKLARKRLSTAKVLLLKNSRQPFFEEVSIAIWGYLGDKLSIPFAELSKENIADVLSSRGVTEGLIKELLDIINKCEFARYAPANQVGQMQDIYDAALSLITKMEGEIR